MYSNRKHARNNVALAQRNFGWRLSPPDSRARSQGIHKKRKKKNGEGEREKMEFSAAQGTLCRLILSYLHAQKPRERKRAVVDTIAFFRLLPFFRLLVFASCALLVTHPPRKLPACHFYIHTYTLCTNACVGVAHIIQWIS